MWDAQLYLKYAEERARPFFDLLARVRKPDAGFIVDLGCGPGNLTRTLGERWPMARIVGVDHSAAMLQQATQLALPGRLDFVPADIASWSFARPVDLIVSNAALQWVPGHDMLLPRLIGMLAPGGTLAVQIPYHFDDPAHLVIEETKTDPRWRRWLEGVGLHQQSVQPLRWYVDLLHDLGMVVDAWQTTYLHVLTGDNPVLEWFKGTALRPLLERLPVEKREAFLTDVGQRMQGAYPARRGITLLPFPRIFFVASRP